MRTIIFVIAGAASAVVSPAAVQSTAAADGSASSAATPVASTPGLGEIVVTAQRRSETLQRAAASISAVGGDALRAESKNSVAAALVDVPAVQVQGNTNGAQIYIRGVGSNADSQLGDPAVNLNVDGIYQQETEIPTSLLYDVNRIEVLRGPQGTLYGRNATAGAVNILTNDPILSQASGYATLQGGNFGEIHSEAAANVPLGETLAARAAFSSDRHTGYLSNGDNDADMIGGRLKLLYRPIDRLRIVLAGEYLHEGGNDLSSVEAPLASHDDYQSDKPRGYLDLRAWNVRGQADYDADWATFSLLAAHNDYDKDEDNVVLAPSGVSIHREARQNTVEARVSSPSASVIKWVGGFYYYHDLEMRQVVPSVIDAIAAPASNPELRDATATSYAGFANLTVPLGDHLRATGGVRYTHDEKSARFIYTGAPAAPDALASHTWNSLTYKAALEADLGPRSLAYAQISSGFKAGGFAQEFPAASYNPEKLTAVEVGSKNRFLDNRLQVNASAYYYHYRDYQAQYPDLVDGQFALVTSNAATAQLYGAEIETRLAITAHDTLGVSASYQHTRFGSFAYVSVLAGSVDHSGEQLPNAPTLSADLSYDHDFLLARGATVTAHVNSHLSRGYWTTVERSLDSYQSSFTRTDAFVSYRPAGGRWDVRVYVRNLENREIRTLGAANPIDAVLLVAPPRTYGAAATLRF